MIFRPSNLITLDASLDSIENVEHGSAILQVFIEEFAHQLSELLVDQFANEDVSKDFDGLRQELARRAPKRKWFATTAVSLDPRDSSDREMFWKWSYRSIESTVLAPETVFELTDGGSYCEYHISEEWRQDLIQLLERRAVGIPSSWLAISR